MAAAVQPPGWPKGLAPPGTDEFDDRVVGWLLDLAPPEFRGHEVFRRHPLVLAWAVQHYVDAALQASRAAYASARAELSSSIAPEVVTDTLRALEFEGVRLATAHRQVAMVREALAGTTWRPRL